LRILRELSHTRILTEHMALQAAYKQFLAAPNPSFLAENASLHYITTLTTLNGAFAIIKHLKGQDYELQKKEEKFLDVVEGPNSLAVEAHTTIEFLTGGGSYLPSLDDNFLADRTVTFPVVSVNCEIHITSADQSILRSTLLPSTRTARFYRSDKIGTRVLSSS
jgi:hypothetical protein